VELIKREQLMSDDNGIDVLFIDDETQAIDLTDDPLQPPDICNECLCCGLVHLPSAALLAYCEQNQSGAFKVVGRQCEKLFAADWYIPASRYLGQAGAYSGEDEHRFRKIRKTVHLQPERVFTFVRNRCSR
jgi:hypothetical protein